MSEQSKSAPALILVVDDDTRNAKLIAFSLQAEGYRTQEAANGLAGLELIGQRKPDLLLLDIMMPGIDGFEVCQRLRADAKTNDLPIILFTALNDSADKIRGLDLGADAFLSKPIERAELLAHVRTHLRVKQLRDEVVASREALAHQNRKLQALEHMRSDLTHMLVHDMKSPLTAIQLKLELMQTVGTSIRPEMLPGKLQGVVEAADQLQSMIQNILDVSRLEEAEVNLRLAPFSAESTFHAVRTRFEVFQQIGGGVVRIEVDPELPATMADGDMISRVIENLVSNAVKLCDDGEIALIAATDRDGSILITVADRGPGVPEHMRETIFEKFSASEAKRSGYFTNHGLGLTFARLAVEAHGGRIWVEPRDGGGSCFRFTLPARAVEHDPLLAPPEHLLALVD